MFLIFLATLLFLWLILHIRKITNRSSIIQTSESLSLKHSISKTSNPSNAYHSYAGTGHDNSRDDKRQSVAIIGAGPSGLAVADTLSRLNYRVCIYESSDKVGGVWTHCYLHTTLQNSYHQYFLTNYPFPQLPNYHPSSQQLQEYFQYVAKQLQEKYGVKIHLNQRVVQTLYHPEKGTVTPTTTKGKWHIISQHSSSTYSSHHQEEQKEEEKDDDSHEERHTQNDEEFDFLVVSTGQYSENKQRATFPKHPSFTAPIITERDINSFSSSSLNDTFHNKRVIVIGFGKSALDMCTLGIRYGCKEMIHLFRTARWILPRYIFGIHFSHMLLNRLSTVMTPSWSYPTLLESIFHRYGKWMLVDPFWSMLEKLIRYLAFSSISAAASNSNSKSKSSLSIEEIKRRMNLVWPSHSLISDFRSAVPLDTEPLMYYPSIVKGDIYPIRGEIQEFAENNTVRLKDGTEIKDVDMVVMCMGNRLCSFPFLPVEMRSVLESVSDGCQLYRHILHPSLPRSLAFAGFNHCILHIPACELGALWMNGVWREELILPKKEEMEKCCNYVQKWKRDHVNLDQGRGYSVTTRIHQYMDTVIKELGLNPYRKLPNVFAELALRYGAEDYAGMVEEYRAHLMSRSTPLHSLPIHT